MNAGASTEHIYEHIARMDETTGKSVEQLIPPE
jgi:hypothetical protein